ncbi:MAG: cell division protein ZapE [Pseudomonadota bacterium]
MDGPLNAYRALVARGELQEDPAQSCAADHLQRLHDSLKGYAPGRKTWLLGRAKPAPKGVYLFGGVGRGKSLLMDLFFDAAPVAAKRRVHFHEFMQEMHERIGAWRALDEGARKARPEYVRGAGEDPIRPAARAVAQEATLLCFDEFLVTDIADAMILGRFFEALLSEGVVSVATSNRVPDNLYKNGLNRQLFTPFIDLLKERFHIVELDGPTDYRMEGLAGAPVYYTPLDAKSAKAMDVAFTRLTGGAAPHAETLIVKGRELVAPRAPPGAARLAFSDQVAAPLSPRHYLANPKRYKTGLHVGV